MKAIGRRTAVLAAALLLAAAAHAQEAQPVFRDAARSGRVVSARIDLASDGIWQAGQPSLDAPVRFVQTRVPEDAMLAVQGQRMLAARRQREIQRGLTRMQAVHNLLWSYRGEGNARTPATLEALIEWGRNNDMVFQAKRASGSEDRPEEYTHRTDGPFLFFVPGVDLPVEDPAEIEDPEIVAFGIRPWPDDGKHYVLYNDLLWPRRVEIDRGLEEKYGVKIRPVKDDPFALEDVPGAFTYEVLALVIGNGATTPVTMQNAHTGERLTADLPIPAASDGPEDIVRRWAAQRANEWMRLRMAGDTLTLEAWMDIQGRMYLAGDYSPPRRFGRAGRSTSVFNVLGGRAAVRETLQMQLIPDEGQDPDAKKTVPIHMIRGVQVESHPYAEMLGDAEGGRLALAEACPVDRFFVYVGRPARVLRMVDSGAAFAGRAGDMLGGSAMAYGLPDRYMKRLGLTEEWARKFIEAGSVKELALFTPDLFFIDGTELTIVCRVPNLPAVLPLLELIGARGLSRAEVVPVAALDGGQAWWAARGDLVVLSTNRNEALDAAALIDNEGSGSLGSGPEFRYMLTQLPPQETTAAYAYFSDAFIRRLVGPEVKIGQFRRMHARGRLELLGAAALLHRAEAAAGEPTPANLRELGYLPEGFPVDGFSIGADLVPRSTEWGSPGAMTTLTVNKPTSATQVEAGAYRRYVEEYTRFWRRFFDPIAMRLDLVGEDSAELTTFILPLLDSEMYGELRQFIGTPETHKTLQAPVLDPEPVLMLSANMAERAWREFAEDFQDWFGSTLRVRLDPQLLEHLGPSIHFAVLDSDPIVSLGSGDALGMFGAQSWGTDSEMMAAAGFITALLRPSKLLVEVDDPEAVAAILRRVSSPEEQQRGGFLSTSAGFYKLGDEDRWIYTFNIGGMLTLRFGVEVADRYLAISTLPWSRPTAVDGHRKLPAVGAGLSTRPGAISDELAALHMATHERLRQTSFGGANLLLPVVLATGTDPAAAAELHRKMFGFAPAHPDGGRWTWKDGYPVSTAYGSPDAPRQPEWDPAAGAPGLLSGLRALDVSAQLEGSGLRTVLRWSWGPAPGPE